MSVDTFDPMLRQPSLPMLCPVTEAVRTMSEGGSDERGAIFTRKEVVDFLLDLTGYTSDKSLYELRLLEPSYGGGDFLLPVLDRLLKAWSAAKVDSSMLKDSIRAVELHRESADATRALVIKRLRSEGIEKGEAESIADSWLITGDFLLANIAGGFDVVIGNPPYVRQELIPDALMAEYRSRYETIFDRADIYVPFIERSLRLLAKGGKCGFICADRWMKNRYGARLRQLVAQQFHLETYVDMVDTPAFHSDVVAYPAITVIANNRGNVTRAAHRPPIDAGVLHSLALGLTAERPGDRVTELLDVTKGADPWILDASPELTLVRRLETDFPTIEESGCKVGIGVATGADEAFIAPFDELDVEDDRKLPLVMTRDIQSGQVEWRGRGVVNPFGPNGKLVDLANYPRLRRYLEERRSQIAGRHVAMKAPANWYRTIDRIYPELAKKPKLLIPDIKGQAHVVFEDHGLYPHHNLYFITSDIWDIRALHAVMLSGIARVFVATYSTKMRGGFLRFQAQYLRRIRLPKWSDVSNDVRLQLRNAALQGDVAACDEAAARLYGLSDEERKALRGSVQNGVGSR
jgi:hypothetical protein